MQSTTFATLVAAIASISIGCASTMQASSKAAGDPNQHFMVTAAQTNLAEIEVGELAMERAQNPAVRQYAQQMVQAHTRAQQELEQLAQQKGVSLPEGPDQAHVELVAHLSQLQGAQFDSEYMSAMTGDHAKALSMYQDKAKLATDPEVRAYAQRHVPGLHDHLAMAKSLNESLGGGSTVAAGPEPTAPPR